MIIIEWRYLLFLLFILADGIPLKNLTSDLSDSANYMWGKKSGVEARLREKAPHLLDIDGDTCHHMHNSTKKFSAVFEKHVERMMTDVHNDVRWSPDILENLRDICLIIGDNYQKPPDRTDHRWLSGLDCSNALLPMFKSMKILYFSFMPKESSKGKCFQNLYKED